MQATQDRRTPGVRSHVCFLIGDLTGFVRRPPVFLLVMCVVVFVVFVFFMLFLNLRKKRLNKEKAVKLKALK